MTTTIFEPTTADLARPPVQVIITRAAGQVLPNLRMLSLRFEEGHPGQAVFRYVFDSGGGFNDGSWPLGPEQVNGPDAAGGLVVMPDDRLRVYFVTDTGDPFLIFDGFAQIAATTLSGARGEQGATFVALAAPIREWDFPVKKRLQRDASTPEDPSKDNEVDLPTTFNPGGQGNATAEGFDGATRGFQHPVFLDEVWVKDNPTKGRAWTVAGAAKYIIARGNGSEMFVHNPDFAGLDTLLDAREPLSSGTMDPRNPATYTSRPITLKETEIKGDCWPDALAKVLHPYGFRFCFALGGGLDPEGQPTWTLDVYRARDQSPKTLKHLYIQDGGDLDPTATNVAEMHLVRDPMDVANEYIVESDLPEYEGAFVLAEGFPVVPSDADNIAKFDKDGPLFAGNEDKYRRYVFDECGDGHWDRQLAGGSGAMSTTPTTLKAILGGKDQSEHVYTKRRRPGRDDLLSRQGADGSDQPRKSLVLISWDYKGAFPGIWDGTGTWYPVSRNWRFLNDRLGIYLNCKNPEGWPTGEKKIAFGVAVKSGGGVVKGVSALAKAGETRFNVMLVTVIEGDDAPEAKAARRDASPSRYTISRVIDARERYKYQAITASSWFNRGATPIVARDDNQAATDDALARRTTNEMPRLAGPVKIPRITLAYQISDRLTDVVGRNQNLRTNAGDGSGEAPTYPRVVALEFNLDGEQSTILHAEDVRGHGRQDHASTRRGR